LLSLSFLVPDNRWGIGFDKGASSWLLSVGRRARTAASIALPFPLLSHFLPPPSSLPVFSFLFPFYPFLSLLFFPPPSPFCPLVPFFYFGHPFLHPPFPLFTFSSASLPLFFFLRSCFPHVGGAARAWRKPARSAWLEAACLGPPRGGGSLDRHSAQRAMVQHDCVFLARRLFEGHARAQNLRHWPSYKGDSWWEPAASSHADGGAAEAQFAGRPFFSFFSTCRGTRSAANTRVFCGVEIVRNQRRGILKARAPALSFPPSFFSSFFPCF